MLMAVKLSFYQIKFSGLESESVFFLLLKEKQVVGAVSGAAVCTNVLYTGLYICLLSSLTGLITMKSQPNYIEVDML